MEHPVGFHPPYPQSAKSTTWAKVRSWDKLLMLFVTLAVLAMAAALFIITIPLFNFSLRILGLQIEGWTAFNEWISQGNLGLIIFAVSGLLALIFAALARFRVKRIPSLYIQAGCPRCHEHELIRVRRRRGDRVLSSVGVPVRRYACRNCTWQGLRVAVKKKKEVQEQVEDVVEDQPVVAEFVETAVVNEMAIEGDLVAESGDLAPAIVALEEADLDSVSEDLIPDTEHAFEDTDLAFEVEDDPSEQAPYVEEHQEIFATDNSASLFVETEDLSPELESPIFDEDAEFADAEPLEVISESDTILEPVEFQLLDDALLSEEPLAEEADNIDLDDQLDPTYLESYEPEVDRLESDDNFADLDDLEPITGDREDDFLFSDLDHEESDEEEGIQEAQDEPDHDDDDNDDIDPDFEKLCMDSVWD